MSHDRDPINVKECILANAWFLFSKDYNPDELDHFNVVTSSDHTTGFLSYQQWRASLIVYTRVTHRSGTIYNDWELLYKSEICTSRELALSALLHWIEDDVHRRLDGMRAATDKETSEKMRLELVAVKRTMTDEQKEARNVADNAARLKRRAFEFNSPAREEKRVRFADEAARNRELNEALKKARARVEKALADKRKQKTKAANEGTESIPKNVTGTVTPSGNAPSTDVPFDSVPSIHVSVDDTASAARNRWDKRDPSHE
ncbi:hypothetical protein SLS60_002327 [Paraconiothyrium brasiliense]|uniref:Uncharacterized protein n=1 Tax=Paraconiothyrium brasiliense TaxID=300254 RepID=A0ABR3S203_9PLEO